ncbi:MAG TPA: hypothetical protein VH062_35330 [Polyangiaceae bacterium]|jgi:hypothetical protein|nr:hypothetical protein [Polyangiaceae bacterium]
MKPTRLVEDSEDGFEVRLLRTALTEEPPHGAILRAEAALGLGVGTAMATAAAATSSHAGALHALSHAGVASIVKWAGIGMVSGLVVAGGARFAADPSLCDKLLETPSASTSAPIRAPTRPALRGATLAPPAFPTTSMVDSTHHEVREVAQAEAVSRPLPRRFVAAAIPAPAASAEPSAPSIEPSSNAVTPIASVTEELAILERARQAIVAHASDVALHELDAYAAMPSARVLGAEAEILAVEALVQRGNIGAAQARAARSLGLAPAGPHAARLREVMALPER